MRVLWNSRNKGTIFGLTKSMYFQIKETLHTCMYAFFVKLCEFFSLIIALALRDFFKLSSKIILPRNAPLVVGDITGTTFSLWSLSKPRPTTRPRGSQTYVLNFPRYFWVGNGSDNINILHKELLKPKGTHL